MRCALALTALLFPNLAGAAPASIRGRVVYEGPAPEPLKIQPTVNPEVCGKKQALYTEGLVLGPEGALANVAAVVLGVTAGDAPPTPAVLTQRNCTFAPHVQTVTLGSPLQIGNDDPVVHNVHARIGEETIFNLGMPLAGTRLQRPLDRPGLVRFSCDSGHAWMEAYLLVVPHEFHATSKADGWFVIPGVPPGRYELRTWHERLGVTSQVIDVEPDRGVEVVVRYGPQALTDAPGPFSFEPEALAQASNAGTRGSAALPNEPGEARGSTPKANAASSLPFDPDGARAAGRGLFRRHCAPCHGDRGNGIGEARRFLNGRARDFTKGEYKFRSTRSGDPPTEDDLVRTISVGVPGTPMPAFARTLRPEDRHTLARYLMTLSDRFRRGPGQVLPIPPAIPASPSSIQEGKGVWERLKCGQCHGERGDSQGVSREMLDDQGDPIQATDLTTGVFKGGSRPEDLYRTLQTGLSGTPMPAFAELLGPEELWALVHYVRSLGAGRAVPHLLGLP